MEIKFLGAVSTVTGSKTLLKAHGKTILIDCGLYQGIKLNRKKNWEKLGFDYSKLDAVILTHAHIDHSGLIPILVRDGYKGPIYCSAPTKELAGIMLPDAGHIHETDAALANRYHYSRHNPALPLYTVKDAEASLKQFRVLEIGKVHPIGDLGIELFSAGHILGATHVRVTDKKGKSLLFSGDIGRFDDDLEYPPAALPHSDYIVMESTYGNRLHGEGNQIEEMARIISETSKKKGVLLIPAFSVGRAQLLCYLIYQAKLQGLCPDIPLYVDSPMTAKVTALYGKFDKWHKLSPEVCAAVFRSLHITNNATESKQLKSRAKPLIILSASGMLTGGRILHHMKDFAHAAENTILLAGFQAPGTRGSALAAGSKELKIHGGYVPILAKVEKLELFSAHADQADLIKWLLRTPGKPERIFINHGEPEASDELRRRIREKIGIEPEIPVYNQKFGL